MPINYCAVVAAIQYSNNRMFPLSTSLGWYRYLSDSFYIIEGNYYILVNSYIIYINVLA